MILLLLACVQPFPERSFAGNPYQDYDEDGYNEILGDCDDQEPAVNPRAEEICNGLDDDCDGLLDADDDDATGLLTGYLDADGDGHGDPDVVYTVCALGDVEPGPAVEAGDDCDDDDNAVNPSATEACGNGVDDNCNGSPDDCGWDPNELLTDAPLILRGNAEGDAVGAAACGGVDLDGDGLADLVGSAPGDDEGGAAAGLVFAVFSSQLADDDAPVEGATAWVEGPYGALRLGARLACVDPVGDESWTVLAAAPSSNLAVEWPGGAVFTLGEWAGDGVLAEPSWYSSSAGNQAGRVLGDGGDLAGPDTRSVVVGTYASGDGALTLVPADSSGALEDVGITTLTGESNDNFGLNPPAVGDVDGDGLDDLLAAAPDRVDPDGVAFLFYGPLTGTTGPADADVTFLGTDDGAFGRAMALGDLDGDGRADVVLSDVTRTVDRDDDGVVVGYSGSALDGATTLDSETDWTFLLLGSDDEAAGSDLALPGDADGDEVPDIVVGTYGRSRGVGGATLAYGPFDGTRALSEQAYTFASETPAGRAGLFVGALGDLANDGPPYDFVVGAPGDSTPGALYVLWGTLGK